MNQARCALGVSLAMWACAPASASNGADAGQASTPDASCPPTGETNASLVPPPTAAHVTDAALALQHEWLVQALLAGTYLTKPADWTSGTVSARTTATSQAMAFSFPGCGFAGTVTSNGISIVLLATTKPCAAAGHTFDGRIAVSIAADGTTLRTTASLTGTLDGEDLDVTTIHSAFTATSYRFETYGRTGSSTRATSGEVQRGANANTISFTVDGAVRVGERSVSVGDATCTGRTLLLEDSVATQATPRCSIGSASFAWADSWTCTGVPAPTASALRHDATWDGNADPPISAQAVVGGTNAAFTIASPVAGCDD